jgi:hypothetical protein
MSILCNAPPWRWLQEWPKRVGEIIGLQYNILVFIYVHLLNLIFTLPCIMTQYSKMTNKMQPCRIICYSLAPLHVSSDIFANHQEYPNCITASVITHVCRCRLVSWECWNFQQSHDTSQHWHTCVIPEAVIRFKHSWWWEKISLETWRAAKE